MKKRTFLKISGALLTTAAVGPLASCESPARRTNWAGNLTYGSDQLFEPESIDELSSIVRSASRIKVQGTCHSFNTIADSQDSFVNLGKLTRIVSLDEENGTVTVEAGLRYGMLGQFLESKGYAIHNLASLPHISVAGAIATATHGSGDGNQNLGGIVKKLSIMTADGSIIETDNRAAIVNLGALGIVTQVTLAIQPTFQVRQWVYRNLPLAQLQEHSDEIFKAGYSVSLFTDWSSDSINQVWVKKKVTSEDNGDGSPELFGARLAEKDVHPIEAISAVNCTPQMGVPGPWNERLPHFKFEFTPSSGEELQAEYFVPREHAVAAILAVHQLREKVNPLIQISEVRSIAADDILMSPFNNQDSIAIHFTWKKEPEGVMAVLPLIEEALSGFNVKPHWGKLFTLAPATLRSRYTGLNEFKELSRSYDPDGKFQNTFLQTNLFA